MTTLTAYPDADPETTTVDGVVSHNNNTTSNWSIVQASASGTSTNDTGVGLTQGFIGAASTGKRPNGNYGIERGVTGFDTSSIGSDTIDSAVVSLYGISKSNGWDSGNDNIFPTEATLISNTSVATGDYDGIGDSVAAPTAWATPIDLSVISTTGYNDWTLNATGEAGINKAGVTNIGWREGDDVTAAPSFGNNQYNGFYPHSADNATGTSLSPKLVVEHSGGGGASRRIFSIS